MERAYYILKCRLDGDDRYLLWYNDDPDGVVVDDEQRFLSFANISLLRSWAHRNGLPVRDGITVHYDLDGIRQWSAHPDRENVDCVAILNAWNLFIDIQSSIEQRNVIRDDPQNDDIYQKVFWGNNLPSVAPRGKSDAPIWSNTEAIRIRAVMKDGIRFFRAHLQHIVPD